ncbi:MAG: hypothetical protein IT204_03395 [Fimbriimonadaceae bacterium]|nr:hypothetical protein [Fimbriimonadaceae bacterium]
MASRKKWIDSLVSVQSIVETVLDWITWAALALGCLGLIYILSGVIGGGMLRLAPADVARIAVGVGKITNLVMYCAVIVSFLAMARSQEHKAEVGFGVVVVGVFFWFGLAPLIAYCISVKAGHSSRVTDILIANLGLAGRAMLLALVWPVLQWLWRQLRAVPLRKKQDAEVDNFKLRREAPKKARPLTKPHFLSPCWHLPYCRDYLVEMCPAFRARKRCWKYGGGCFCDSSMIQAMLTGVSSGPRGGQQAWMRSELEARNTIYNQRGTKPPCRRCFIYMEHEKLKYEMMHPLAYPGAAAIMYFGYEPLIKPGFAWFQESATQLWQQLAFQAVTEAPKEVPGLEFATIMFTVLAGGFLLLGLLRLCELWCFKWKL